MRYLGHLDSDSRDSRAVGIVETRATHPRCWCVALIGQETDDGIGEWSLPDSI